MPVPPSPLFSGGQRLGDVLQAVLDRVPDRRTLGLVADFREDGSLGVLRDDLHPDPGVGRPSAPVAGGAVRLPGVEDVALNGHVAAGGDDLVALLLEPLLEVVLAVAGGVLGLAAPAVAFEFLDGDRGALL